MSLFNGISLFKVKAVFKLLDSVLSFASRAEEDGAIVESIKCVNNAFKASGTIDGGEFLFNHYSLRVASLGGTTEANVCTVTKLNELL